MKRLPWLLSVVCSVLALCCAVSVDAVGSAVDDPENPTSALVDAAIGTVQDASWSKTEAGSVESDAPVAINDAKSQPASNDASDAGADGSSVDAGAPILNGGLCPFTVKYAQQYFEMKNNGGATGCTETSCSPGECCFSHKACVLE